MAASRLRSSRSAAPSSAETPLGPAAASPWRSSRTASTVSRSIPLRASSIRSARSPRGWARSRDSTHVRANASSSRYRSSVRRAIVLSTSSAAYPNPRSRRLISSTERGRASRSRALASRTSARSVTSPRLARRSANVGFGLDRRCCRPPGISTEEGLRWAYSASSIPSTGRVTSDILARIRRSISAATSVLPLRNSLEASRP